jgi:hypothetical protein
MEEGHLVPPLLVFLSVVVLRGCHEPNVRTSGKAACDVQGYLAEMPHPSTPAVVFQGVFPLGAPLRAVVAGVADGVGVGVA